MIAPETKAEIFRFVRVEHLSITRTAKLLGIHHSTVRRVLEAECHSPTIPRIRKSKLDSYAGFIHQKLEEHPGIRATNIWRMLKDRGYSGCQQSVRNRVQVIRGSKQKKAYLPITAFAGDEAQVDWAHFGSMAVGRTSRKLSCFIMVLAYSRAIFARFFFDQTLDSFLAGHVEAFTYFQGVARQLRYDNLKAAVSERHGKAIRFNSHLLDLAGYYAFKPSACNPYAGYEKGRVERAVRYIRESFFVGREFNSIEQLNKALDEWVEQVALRRSWPDDRNRIVAEVFAEERSKLIPLSREPYSVRFDRPVKSGKIPFIRFDKNDYSIPFEFAGQQLSLSATRHEIFISKGYQVIAQHRRSYSGGERVIVQEHFARLIESRPGAGTVAGRCFIAKEIPQADALFRLMVERGVQIGSAAAKLIELMRVYGKPIVEKAIAQAVERSYGDANYVAKICDQLSRQGKHDGVRLPFDISPQMPAHNLQVTPHDVTSYDELI